MKSIFLVRNALGMFAGGWNDAIRAKSAAIRVNNRRPWCKTALLCFVARKRFIIARIYDRRWNLENRKMTVNNWHFWHVMGFLYVVTRYFMGVRGSLRRSVAAVLYFLFVGLLPKNEDHFQWNRYIIQKIERFCVFRKCNPAVNSKIKKNALFLLTIIFWQNDCFIFRIHIGFRKWKAFLWFCIRGKTIEILNSVLTRVLVYFFRVKSKI